MNETNLIEFIDAWLINRGPVIPQEIKLPSKQFTEVLTDINSKLTLPMTTANVTSFTYRHHYATVDITEGHADYVHDIFTQVITFDEQHYYFDDMYMVEGNEFYFLQYDSNGMDFITLDNGIQRHCDLEVVSEYESHIFRQSVSKDFEEMETKIEIAKEKICTCGAKHTSNPGYHTKWCDIN